MKQHKTTNNDRFGGRSACSAAKRTMKPRSSGPRVPEASREAKRIAACVLEVLAGASSPTAAAAALDVSLPRYYLLEQRAIEALVNGCEPRTGRTISPDREVDIIRKQLERAERDATRYQTLLRVAQRTIGLAPPVTPTGTKTKGAKAKRTRRPTARALVAARTLRFDDNNAEAKNDSAATLADNIASSSVTENQPGATREPLS
jgi:hypothetical protein